MNTKIFLEMYELIASYLNILGDYLDVQEQFYFVLVVYAVLVLLVGYIQNRRLTMIITFTLVAFLLSYIMRDVENKGFVVTSFSLVALITTYIVYNRKFENYIVFNGVIGFYLLRLINLNLVLSLIISLIWVLITYRFISLIVTILSSVIFGSIVLAQYINESSGFSFVLALILLLFVGLVVQVTTVGIKVIWLSIKELFGLKKGSDTQ